MMRNVTTIKLSREDVIAAVERFLKEQRFQGAVFDVESIAAENGVSVTTPAVFVVTLTFPQTGDDID